MSRLHRAIPTSVVAVVSFILGSAEAASAHAFGQRYDLPVPLWLYVLGAAVVVAFSFVVIGVFVRGTPGVRSYPRLNLLRSPAGRFLAHPAILSSLKLASTGLFILLILAGLVGDQYPLRNLAPTVVWIIWWVGLAYISALAGDLWALINPWKVLFGWAEILYRRSRHGRELSRQLPYPEALGMWPGAILFLAFSWVELVFHGSAVPSNIAVMAVTYSVITWTGMFLFGREQWLRHGEAFSLVFGVLARFAPTEVRVVRSDVCKACVACRDRDGECINCYECFCQAESTHREWNLRPYAVGLLRNEPVPTSMMIFVLLMLSTVTFDGFKATPAWASIESFFDFLLPDLAGARLTAIRTLGLITFPMLFLGIYLTVSGVMSAASGWRLSIGELARSFAFSLVPIALAYHMAHYLSFLLIQGQLIIPLASDPFGFGWNLLGTAGYRINIGVVGARFGWYTAVIAIVTAHIIAVYLAHVIATRSLEDRVPALRSQYPMSALMVGYTIVSLWILAQPIVESGVRSPATAERSLAEGVRIPQDAVIPEPGTGRLREIGEGNNAEAMITYRVLASKFHDGTQLGIADLLYPYVFAFRWAVKKSPNDIAYDPTIEAATALIRETLGGLKVVRVDKIARGFGQLKLVRTMPVIEVYLNSARGDAQQVASIAPPWSSLPWHLIVLMEEAVTRGWAAFSKEEAQRRRVAWLDLVRVKHLKSRLASLVEEFDRQRYLPDTLRGLVTGDEAKQRWASLRKFYRGHGHFLVTNGPYILKEWTEESVTLQVFRDLSYPLGVGSFDAYPVPRRAYISRIETRENGLRVSAEVERLEQHQRTYEIVREPLERNSSGGLTRDIPACRYIIIASGGEVLVNSSCRLGKDGLFTADLKEKLGPGRYTVLSALYLNGNYINPDVRMFTYRVNGPS
ncbi:MAG: hypothetical protein ACE5G5_00570 [Candidatus Methylomirabilales bacterium]